MGFHIAAHDFSNKAMGSSYCIIESNLLRIRFENDRGLLSVDIAATAEPERWMNLSAFGLFLNGERPTPELDGWVSLLQNHLGKIADPMGLNYEGTKIAFDGFLSQTAGAAARSSSGSAASTVRRAVRNARIRALVMGPLGWIAAAVMLIWLLIR
jgi:hypothetical protein